MNNNPEYALISRGDGAKIRGFLDGAKSTQPVTSRSALLAQLRESGIPAELHDAVLDAYKAIVVKGRDADVSAFRLSHEVDAATLGIVRRQRADDDLFGDDGIEAPADAEPVDAAAIVDAVMDFDRGRPAGSTAHERQAAAERRRIGLA